MKQEKKLYGNGSVSQSDGSHHIVLTAIYVYFEYMEMVPIIYSA